MRSCWNQFIGGLIVFFGATCSVSAQSGPELSHNSDTAKVQNLRVAGIVLKWLRADKEANDRRGAKMIREAAAGGAKIVITTECFLDGFMNGDRTLPLSTYRALAERPPRLLHRRRPRSSHERFSLSLCKTKPWPRTRKLNSSASVHAAFVQARRQATTG